MKKTTVRFAAVGAVLLLGALAFAFAQHDARQRPPETTAPELPLADTLQPIVTDKVPKWTSAKRETSAERAVVRANDDHPFGSPPALAFDPAADSAPSTTLINSLRETNAVRGAHSATEPPSLDAIDGGVAPLSEFTENAESSAIALASGEGVAAAPATLLPGSPPLATTPLPGASSLPSTSSLPSAQGVPSASSVPSTASGNAASASIALPSAAGLLDPPPALPPATGSPHTAPAGAAAPPGWVNGSAVPSTGRAGPSLGTNQSLSDTQRPAMPATTLPSAQRSGEQAWVQAPALGAGTSGGAANAPLTSRPSAGTAIGSTAIGLPVGSHGNAPGLMPSATLGTPQGAPVRTLDAPPANLARGVPGGGSRPPFAGTVLGTLVSNQPGNRHLDGSQNPIMLIQKRMAGECQVGKRATVVITVRNAGNSVAQDVEVVDSVPHGASFAEAIPAVTPTPEGVLVWQLGEMGPGDERTINLQIVPERQGELGSTAAVKFAAQVSVRTLATLPKLELTPSAAPDVLIGSPYAIDVVVKNVGTGVARAVMLEADLPQNVRFESGDASLEASFGDIAPGESRRIRLDSIATEAGQAFSSIRALTEDGIQQEQKVELRVLAPVLKATITGPNKRYLDRQATFTIVIENSGTAAATNCEFMMRLPAGLNFNTANAEGAYDPAQHAVLWSVPEFPAGHSEPVELTVLPVEIGNQQMTFQGTADLGVKADARGSLVVEEQGELSFTIDQDADPVEITGSTTYTVEIRNVGRVDRNVELVMQLPAGSQVLKVDAPVPSRIDGNQLRFEPIPQMDSRVSHKFRMEVRHAKVGTQIVRAQLKSQNRPTPVIKEEATDVYNDRE